MVGGGKSFRLRLGFLQFRQPETGKKGFALRGRQPEKGENGFSGCLWVGLILLAVIGLIVFQRVKLGFHGGIFAREFFHGQIFGFVVGKAQVVFGAEQVGFGFF